MLYRNWANICVCKADRFFSFFGIDNVFFIIWNGQKKVKWWILSNDKWVKWNDESAKRWKFLLWNWILFVTEKKKKKCSHKNKWYDSHYTMTFLLSFWLRVCIHDGTQSRNCNAYLTFCQPKTFNPQSTFPTVCNRWIRELFNCSPVDIIKFMFHFIIMFAFSLTITSFNFITV